MFVDEMEWRQFVALWRGLGPNSLWRALDEGGEKVITDEKESERVFMQMFG